MPADSVALGVPQQGGGGDAAHSAPEDANDARLGLYSWFPYSPEPFVKLSDEARGALITLDQIATQTDEAARRLEIEQSWEA